MVATYEMKVTMSVLEQPPIAILFNLTLHSTSEKPGIRAFLTIPVYL